MRRGTWSLLAGVALFAVVAPGLADDPNGKLAETPAIVIGFGPMPYDVRPAGRIAPREDAETILPVAQNGANLQAPGPPAGLAAPEAPKLFVDDGAPLLEPNPTLAHSAAIVTGGPPGRYVPRIDLRYLTEGAGYDRGYFSVAGVLPYARAEDGLSLGIVEGRMLIDDSGKLGANAIWTGRTLSTDSNPTVSGSYWAFDWRDDGASEFRQLSFGGDKLREDYESRTNLYLPLGRNRKTISETPVIAATDAGPALAIQREYQAAMYGIDGEMGWRLWKPTTWANLWGFVGGYHYQAGGSKQAWGFKARAEVRLWDLGALLAQYQTDGNFGSFGIVGAEIYFPGTRARNSGPCGMIADRLYDPIRRTSTITLDRQTSIDPLP
ncbi:MAG TPA: hypothetical protein VNC50_01390 [Planctomycetia bacterium]|nr:hypothetical protein [Planctomycetia bacterium]